MLIAENLCKSFIIKKKDMFWHKSSVMNKEVVKNVDLKIEKGQIVGLLGLNGAGKTTTIKMLSTMLEPTQGTVVIDGIDALKDPMRAKTMLNLITGGERNIYWRLTARENLQYFGSLYSLSGKILDKQIEAVLQIVELEEVADTPVEKYSKGMKQRLQIARGLINDPNYLFLDEPTLGLDIMIASQLKRYIKKLALANNKGILLTTHYIGEADELCDYIYVIDTGKIIAEGTPKRIKEHYTRKYKTQFTILNSDRFLLEKLKNIAGVLEVLYKEETCEIEILSLVDLVDVVQNVIGLNQMGLYKIIKIVSIEPSLEETLHSIIEENRK